MDSNIQNTWLVLALILGLGTVYCVTKAIEMQIRERREKRELVYI